MIKPHYGIIFPTKLNKWHLKKNQEDPYRWNMADDFVEKINMIIQKGIKNFERLLIQRK